ncbi:hypothetical protein [Microbacterium sp. MM2322]|uniref:hypothetical protein n=1 Tax=Microbacterium sp. MM2322 TaxID=3157631 RepID=UPI0032D59DDC
MDEERESRPPLRQRIRAAGGFYAWWNNRLIRYAGPASVGPYETEPEPIRTERACPLCGNPMSQHTFDRTGERPLIHCP